MLRSDDVEYLCWSLLNANECFDTETINSEQGARSEDCEDALETIVFLKNRSLGLF